MPLKEVLTRLGLSEKDLKLAKQYGGFCESDWEVDEGFANLRYCDKGGHRERSMGNNPEHFKHTKKNN